MVFHAAAIRDRWGMSPEEYRRVNVEGTRRLLEVATASRAARFVYVSSVGVLGRPETVGIDESFPVAIRPGAADYHGTKAAVEQLVRAWPGGPRDGGGPADDHLWARRPRRHADPPHRPGRPRPLLRIGRGKNHLHLTYIDDLVPGALS